MGRERFSYAIKVVDRWQISLDFRNLRNPNAGCNDTHDAHRHIGKVDGQTSDEAHVRATLVANDVDPAGDEVDAAEDKSEDRVHQANDEEEEDNDGHLLEEVFMSSLIQRKVEPVLI